MPKHNVFRDGYVHVCEAMCETCVFHPGNRMQLKSGRLRGMIDEALANESCIPCHHQIFYVRGKKQDAVCRGFFDRYQTLPIKLALVMERIRFIRPHQSGRGE